MEPLRNQVMNYPMTTSQIYQTSTMICDGVMIETNVYTQRREPHLSDITPGWAVFARANTIDGVLFPHLGISTLILEALAPNISP